MAQPPAERPRPPLDWPGYRQTAERDRAAYRRSGRTSRRTVLISTALSAVTGVLVALGLESLTAARSPHAVWETLVTMKGRWVLVATTDELPVGAVRSFVAGSLQGVLVHDESHYYALSRVCTHMGCRLAYGDGERTLLCPCHGARFDLYGRSLAGPIGTDALLPPLPHIKTRVRGRLIEVYSV